MDTKIDPKLNTKLNLGKRVWFEDVRFLKEGLPPITRTPEELSAVAAFMGYCYEMGNTKFKA